MQTPIYDFVSEYIRSDTSRLHMPGHKGVRFLGPEDRDLTEIKGADALYEADGIIRESEANATALFGTAGSFYSTEGSSHGIRAMLFLAGQVFGKGGRHFRILASRNVHKAFIHACALLDYDVEWLYAMGENSICSCQVTPEQLEQALSAFSEETLPEAVYVTSPDYLGNVADIRKLSDICAGYGLPLLVDNAHGAYLHFLKGPVHPMDLGAALCCDSGHKTLPVLTGGAYLHVASLKHCPYYAARPGLVSELLGRAKTALSLFGTTSPSYLILQSLDLCNRYLAEGYPEKLCETIGHVEELKKELRAMQIPVIDTEALKLVVGGAPLGLTGADLAEQLRTFRVEVEFADAEYIVLMFTPETRPVDYERVREALCALMPRPADTKPLPERPLRLPRLEKACSLREAVLSPGEIIPTLEAAGRICAVPTVSCPPAIPIAVSGERFTPEAVSLLLTYGVEEVAVVK